MISEIDIKDMTELYKLNRGDHFKLAEDDLKTPPDAPEVDPESIWKFLKVDGMYAQITNGGPVSFVAAWTKVVKVDVSQDEQPEENLYDLAVKADNWGQP